MLFKVPTITRFGIGRFLTQLSNSHEVLRDRGDAAGLSQLQNGFRVATFDNGRPKAEQHSGHLGTGHGNIHTRGDRFSAGEFHYRDDYYPAMYGAVPEEGIDRGHLDYVAMLVANSCVGKWDRSFAAAFNAPSPPVIQTVASMAVNNSVRLGGLRSFSSASAETITRDEFEKVRIGLGQVEDKMNGFGGTMQQLHEKFTIQRDEVVTMIMQRVNDKLIGKHDTRDAWRMERFTIAFVFLIGSAVVGLVYYFVDKLEKKVDKRDDKMEAKMAAIEKELSNLKNSIVTFIAVFEAKAK
ncbi:hypothetical protein GPALN_001921 [Globodera pallida]|nr:hypothetical protein GPALN_001921 [Globodera pallida]